MEKNTVGNGVLIMRIAVCDDNINDIKKCCTFLENIKAEQKLPFEIVTYDNGEKLLFAADNDKYDIDIVYLDIMMPGINGLEVAVKLRSMKPSCQIIFLTRVKDKWSFAFEIEACDYLIKDEFIPKRFEKVFMRAYGRAKKKKEEYAIFARSGETCNIPVSSIKYFEANKKMVTVFYNDKSFTFYSPISKIEEAFLARGFIRVHRGYLVQREYVEKVAGGNLILVTGEEIPVGRVYRQTVKSVFENK